MQIAYHNSNNNNNNNKSSSNEIYKVVDKKIKNKTSIENLLQSYKYLLIFKISMNVIVNLKINLHPLK